jgi:hypothetical protein
MPTTREVDSVVRAAGSEPGGAGETTTTRFTCGSSSRAISQQLPLTSSATRSLANRLSASARIPSGVLATGPTNRVFPSSQIATTQKSRCTSSPIARPTHLTNAANASPLIGCVRETQRDNDTDRYEL